MKRIEYPDMSSLKRYTEKKYGKEKRTGIVPDIRKAASLLSGSLSPEPSYQKKTLRSYAQGKKPEQNTARARPGKNSTASWSLIMNIKSGLCSRAMEERNE